MQALTQIVAERGYSEVKVRDLVKLAGVSTRSFYEHFSSKEDCFVRTYELLARQATRTIIAAQVDEDDWRNRPRQVFEAFARGIASDPAAAHLVMVEAYRAGPAVREYVWRSERAFEAMVAESLARQPDGVEVPHQVVEGMVAGIAHVARTRLTSGRINEIPTLHTELIDWALCFPHEAAMALSELDMRSVGSSTRRSASSPRPNDLSGDRALIVAAVGKLVASEGFQSLTIPRIRGAAGISRRKFDNHFDGVEDCFVATLELHASEALARSTAAQTASRSWSGGIYRAIDALCEQTAKDPFLASVCVAEGFIAGSNAARCKQRLVAAVIEQFQHSIPQSYRSSSLRTEAAAGALWALFQRYVARTVTLQQGRRVAPTLSYMALAPVIGPSAAMTTIRSEQDA
jgi:AcrR family transcriptional regulator